MQCTTNKDMTTSDPVFSAFLSSPCLRTENMAEEDSFRIEVSLVYGGDN